MSLPMGFPGSSMVKNQPANAGDTGFIPGWEDLLEEEMAAHSGVLICRIPVDRGTWTRLGT